MSEKIALREYKCMHHFLSILVERPRIGGPLNKREWPNHDEHRGYIGTQTSSENFVPWFSFLVSIWLQPKLFAGKYGVRTMDAQLYLNTIRS